MITQKAYEDLRYSLNECFSKDILHLVTMLGNTQRSLNVDGIIDVWIDGMSIGQHSSAEDINLAIEQEVINEMIADNGRLIYQLSWRGMWVYYILDRHIYQFERERDGGI